MMPLAAKRYRGHPLFEYAMAIDSGLVGIAMEFASVYTPIR